MSTFDKVKEVVIDKLGVDEAAITEEAHFVNDLGADSLDTVELIMEFEEEFGIEIPDEEAENITTISSAIKYIDEVHVFGSRKELEQLIEFYNPDILIVGGDWRNGEVVGKEYAKEVRFFNRVGGYSTTKLIDNINHKYHKKDL